MNLRNYLSVVIIFSYFPANAASFTLKNATIESVSKLNTCNEALAMVANFQVPLGSAAEFKVGTFETIDLLLSHTTMKKDDQQALLRLFRLTSKRLSNDDSILANTMRQLRYASNDESSLLIYVVMTEETWSDKNTGALYFGFNDPILEAEIGHISRLREFYQGSVPFGTIFMRRTSGLNEQSLEWAMFFLHEATHFADAKLRENWVNANKKLEGHGLAPDEWYSRFQKMDDETIRSEWWELFTEARAYYAMVQAFDPEIVSAQELPKLKQVHAKKAMDQLTNAHFAVVRTGPNAFLSLLNINIDNIFEWGDQVGRAMNATIKLAKTLK